MQQRSLGYGIKGFHRFRRYAYRMDTISQTAAHRLKVLNFWAKHGLCATIDAFGHSRRTLYSWKKAYHQANGNTASLNNQSRAPLNRRQPHLWDPNVLDRLLQLRREFPFLGFEKIHLFLADWCHARNLNCPSLSTLRRRAKVDTRLCSIKQKTPPSQRMKVHGQRRHKGYRPSAPGQCIGIDTIEIHGSGCYSGMRRYVVTYKDMFSRFALGAALPSKHAKHTTKLWAMSKACYPFTPQYVLTDNGSEFKAEFTQTVLGDGSARWLTYPNCHKMNAHAERFNRCFSRKLSVFLDFNLAV